MEINKLFSFLYYLAIILVILFCVFAYFFLTSETSKCIQSPLKYHEEKLGDGYRCFCYKLNPYGIKNNPLIKPAE